MIKFATLTATAVAVIALWASQLPAQAAGDTAANKKLAIEALMETLVKGNAGVIDKYFGPEYIQHNPDIPDGTEALKGLINELSSRGKFSAEFTRTIAEDNMVAFHGRYEGFGPTPMIAFDVFRLEDGKIVEHWDNLIPEAAPNPSGHTARRRDRDHGA